MIRGVLLSIPLLFWGCGSKLTSWQCHQRKCRIASHSASDLFLPVDQLGVGLELRFRKGASGDLCFVSVYEGEIPPFQGNPTCAEIWILVEDEEPQQRIVTRLEGGQRLLLDQETSDHLLALVREETPFELRLRSQHYSEVGFHKLKKRMRKWEKLNTSLGRKSHQTDD